MAFGKKEKQPGEPFTGSARIQTGIPRLDDILKGGLMRGGIYSVMGPPGSGKTIFGNQLCFHHIDLQDGRCVYLTLLVESHAKMMAHLGSLTFFRRDRIPDRLYYISGYQALKQEGLAGLLSLIRKTLSDRKATFLVVDGVESIEQAAPDTIRAILEEEGYEVLACGNGHQALERLGALTGQVPDLLLVDVMMPILGGYELVKRLREIPALARVPVVMMSAVDPPARKAVGWQQFLAKPFTLEKLIDTVHKMVSGAKA